MHIHKPDDVLLLQSYHALGGEPRWIVTVGYVVQKDGSFLDEAQAWPWLLPHFPDEAFDGGLKKARGAYGVAGQAWAPAGQPVSAMAVRVQIGALEKTLHVHGERHWQRGAAGWRPSDAQPFQSMPLTLRQAYGGTGYGENPYGRGWLDDSDQAQGVPLPVVEHPHQPVLSPADRFAPATLTRLPAGAGSRMQWVGRLDERWQQERFPWLPDDTDSRWFDGFAQDQVQNDYWLGNEHWRVYGMHPDQAEVSGRLPGLRPRLLLRRQGSQQIEQAPLDLDTVWLFPEQERVLLLYRASIPVQRADAADVAAAAVFTERAGEPQATLPQLLERWRLEAPAGAGLAAGLTAGGDEAVEIDDMPKLETGAGADEQAFDPALLAALQDSLEQGRVQANTLIADMEQRMAPYAPVDLPRIDPLPPLDLAQAEQAQLASHETEQSLEQALQDGQSLLLQQVQEMAERAGLDPEPLLAAASRPNPPVSSEPLDVLAEIQAMRARFPQAPQEAFDALEEEGRHFQSELADMDKRLEALEAELAPLRTMQATQADSRVFIDNLEHLQRHIDAGLSLSGCELSGLDLRAFPLDGMDLSSAVLQDCNLAGMCINHLDLTGARLSGCDLQSSVLTQARLAAGQWEQCRLEGGVFAGAQADKLTVSECILDGSDWSGAQLNKAELTACSLERTRFDHAVLRAATLSSARGRQADFSQACLVDARLDTQCVLGQANFRQADLRGASVQHSDLGEAGFDQADLTDAFFQGCAFSRCTGWQALATRAVFKDVNWSGARWPGANFLDAVFDYARIEQVDWRGANLYGARLSDATVLSVDLEGALLSDEAMWMRHAQGEQKQ